MLDAVDKVDESGLPSFAQTQAATDGERGVRSSIMRSISCTSTARTLEAAARGAQGATGATRRLHWPHDLHRHQPRRVSGDSSTIPGGASN